MAGSEDGSVEGGEADLPPEHTMRVRSRTSNPPSNLKVHDEGPSSTELAQRSRRQRRRERDQHAERRAVQVLLLIFVGLGGAALAAVSFWPEEPSTPPPVVVGDEDPNAPPLPPKQPRTVSSFQESTDLPALRTLREEGLTIAAEGLPEVTAGSDGLAVARSAALETCRFAYGVWEFSPNKRFRFLTTCGALDGQILVGAYEVRGTKVLMSPLGVGGVQLSSTFEVQRPSRMTTEVMARGQTLSVSQRVTAIKPGMAGEGFRATYIPKNTLVPQGGAPAPAAPAPPQKKRDPLLDLLQK